MFTINVSQQADGSYKVSKAQEFTDASATSALHEALAKLAPAA